MNNRLLDIIACPICQGRLDYQADDQQLICQFDKVVYPIENGIPVLLAEQAKPLSTDQQK
ncbi:MAG: Trm112 family protein [Pasteurellaceae bacterium]|nr:Trm112 family protein [Pasteurellaceae bacterium]